MTTIVSKFLQSSAFGFVDFCKKYLAKVDKSVKPYCTKIINGFVTLNKQFELTLKKIVCWCYNENYKDFKYVAHTFCECLGIFCLNY
jgi:hypothetical protein